MGSIPYGEDSPMLAAGSFNATEHPTAQWAAQQIVEAFPFDTAPSYLIRDGDDLTYTVSALLIG